MDRQSLLRATYRAAVAVVLTGAAGLAVAGPAAAAAPVAPPAHFTRCSYGPTQALVNAGIAHDSVEAQMATMINNYRAQNGLPALRVSTSMQKIAYWASVDSAFRGVSPSDHVDTLGRAPRGRAVECAGYSANAYLGEINYWGEGGGPQGNSFGSAASAFAWWKQSPGHNALMLSRTATTFGVGRAYMGVNAERQHWTVNFGTS
jgi:uncharacterized protein YkwD